MKKVKNIVLVSLILGTLISYSSVWVSPAFFKLSAGVSIFIPVFLVLNLICFLFFLFRKSSRILVPLALLFLGYSFIQVSFATNAETETEGDLSVLSYNVRWFEGGQKKEGNDIHDFVIEQNADVVCLQEFYAIGQHVQSIKLLGNYKVAIEAENNKLAIFSKFPVLQSDLLFKENKFNNIQFADLLIRPGDTLRVYNIHLQSMGINTSNLQNTEGIRKDYEVVKTKFLEGAAVRAGQIDSLMKHVEDCPYPIIVSGDFNDVPFSYNHFKLRRGFSNAFEEAGSGFGITYNGRLPFLRIDHQFFSKGVNALSFYTFDDVNYSDHFPILGIYALSP